jgi:hypothetical protein
VDDRKAILKKLSAAVKRLSPVVCHVFVESVAIERCPVTLDPYHLVLQIPEFVE